MYEKPVNPDKDAPLNPTRVAATETTNCMICGHEFPYYVSPRGIPQKYCSEPCKNKAKNIQDKMRRRGIPLDNHEAFLTLVEEKYGTPANLNRGKAELFETRTRAKILSERKAVAQARTKEAEAKKVELEVDRLKTEAAHAEAIKRATEAAELIPITEASPTTLTEYQQNQLRGSLLHMVEQQLPIAEKVMTGEVKWSQTQTTLFTKMLNKVLPDASAATQRQFSKSSQSISDLSVEELEALVATHSKEKVVSES